MDFAKEYNTLKCEYQSIDNQNAYKNSFGIIIDQKAIKIINEEEDLQKIFLNIVMHASSVICCRVSPIQKAQVIKMMKNYDKDGVALAVGDEVMMYL